MNSAAIPVVSMFMICSFLIAREVMIASRKKEEARLRHATYQKLIETGQLDRKTLDEIVAGLEGRRPGRAFLASILDGSLLFVVGWLGIFAGAALLAGGAAYRDGEMIAAGWIVGLISLGVTTLPLAWREVQERFRHEGEERV